MAQCTREQVDRWNAKLSNGFRLDLERFIIWNDKVATRSIELPDGKVLKADIGWTEVREEPRLGCFYQKTIGMMPRLSLSLWTPSSTPGMWCSRGLGAVVFDAMTHAFFTLSVGIGAMEIFGSYQKREHSIPGEAANIVILDTFVALMAGFIIIPACFAYGVQPDAGPSLLFITLPNVFNNMAGGRIWGTCFFIFMSFAALSTIIAVFENIISFYMDMGGWSRKKAVIFNIVLIIALSLPAVLGFNLLSGFQPMGAGSSVMDLEDFLVSYNLLPLGSMIFVLFCVKKNGWGWENFRKEANDGKGLKISNKLQFYMTYILPAIIVIVYLKGYYDTFAKMGPKVLAGWMTFAAVLLAIIFGLSSVKKKTKK